MSTTIDHLLQQARSEEQHLRMGAISETDFDEEYPSAYQRARGALLRAARELRALRNHRCRWSADDYCVICGTDGRA